MGVTGVHATAGLSTGDFEEAATKSSLHASAAEPVVLTFPEKLGAASAFVIAALQDIATLVVSAATPRARVAALRAAGVQVLQA